MDRGGNGRDDFFGFGGFPFGFGGIGGFGRQGGLIPSLFGGKDPFDDPFFTRPFEGFMNQGPFHHGESLFGATSGFLEHESLPQNRSRGPIIKELNSDDEEEEDEQNADSERRTNRRKHLRRDNNPYVEEPDDHVEARKNNQLYNISEVNRANAKPQQNGSYFFQSSTVSYGGPNGTYYTSSTTRRAGGDGVVMEESKEADLNAGKANHRISRGMRGKGHSVTRKLNSDGRVDTLQTLHNLNPDEIENFEEDWNGEARQYFPEWNSAPANDKMRLNERARQKLESSKRLALPSSSHPQSSWANAGQASSSKMASAHSKLHPSGRTHSQTRSNPYDRRFH